MSLKILYKNPNHKKENTLFYDKENTEVHKVDFGLDVPQGYFSKSKIEILEKTTLQTKRKKVLRLIGFSSAVAAVLLLGVLFSKNTSTLALDKEIASKEIDVTNTILVTALFVDDSKLNKLSDSYMLDEFYVEDLEIQ